MRRYGAWAGNPKGTPENVANCIVQVYRASSYIPGQCARKRGHGEQGLFCWQHQKLLPTSYRVPKDK